MKSLKYILTNVISILIEYLLAFLILRMIFRIKIKIVLLILGIVFIILTMIVIFAVSIFKKQDSEANNNQKMLQNIIDEVNNKYHKNISLVCVSSPQPNPAWCIGGKVYINNEYHIDAALLPGVIAHEIGHYFNGINYLTPITSLKLSTIVAKFLYLLIYKFYNQNMVGIKKVFFKILVGIYYLFSLNNLIFVYPLIRQDEYDANRLAVELGYGKELRAYYGYALKYYDRYLSKLDFLHPLIPNMIDEMNEQMHLNKIEKMIYSTNHILYYSDIMTKTCKLSGITIIKEHAINSTNDKLVKLELNDLLSLDARMVGNITSVQILIAHNLRYFDCALLLKWRQVEQLVVDDEKIYEQILIYSKNHEINEKLLKYITNKLSIMKK